MGDEVVLVDKQELNTWQNSEYGSPQSRSFKLAIRVFPDIAGVAKATKMSGAFLGRRVDNFRKTSQPLPFLVDIDE